MRPFQRLVRSAWEWAATRGGERADTTPVRARLLESDDGRTVPRSPAQAPRTVSHRWRVRLAVAALGGVLSVGIVGAIILLPLGSRARPRFLALRQALGWGYGRPLP
jgi:hypothetical protein